MNFRERQHPIIVLSFFFSCFSVVQSVGMQQCNELVHIFKCLMKGGIVACACNPSTWEILAALNYMRHWLKNKNFKSPVGEKWPLSIQIKMNCMFLMPYSLKIAQSMVSPHWKQHLFSLQPWELAVCFSHSRHSVAVIPGFICFLIIFY